MLLPGFSYVAARTVAVGWRGNDRTSGGRILDAIGVSALFLVTYASAAALAAGDVANIETWATETSRNLGSGWTSAVLLLLLVIIPGALGWLLHVRYMRVATNSRRRPHHKIVRSNRERPTAHGWDWGVYRAVTPRFVRITLETGKFIGGWFGHKSYGSTHPHSRDLFIEEPWVLDENGAFLHKLNNGLGIWVAITDDRYVEWLAAPRSPEDEDLAHAKPSKRARMKAWLTKTAPSRTH